MKKILIAIVITILIILILLVLLSTINQTENNKNISNVVSDYHLNNNISNEVVKYDFEENNQIEEIVTHNKINYIEDKNEYFTINNIISKYIELVGDRNIENLIKLLSPEYLREFNITKENIKYNIPERENYTQFYYLDIENLLKVEVTDRNTLYLVNANVSIKYTTNKYKLNIMIETDRVNLTYNIYPEDYLTKYTLNDLKVGNTIQFNSSAIENRNNINKYTYINSITEKEIVNKIFDDYIYKLKVDTNDAYNKLNKEYAQKRFNTKEQFNEFIEESKNIINFAKISEYKSIKLDDSNGYICTDQYDNYYIFIQEKGIMNYSVLMDNYTIMLEEDINNYNELDKFGKAQLNINKFIQMVNMKDYNCIYNVLDNTFKNNNFSNVQTLKKYLQNNMYAINSIHMEDYDNKTYEYIVFKCRIINKQDESQSKEMTIIINQSETAEFTMSFSINEQ